MTPNFEYQYRNVWIFARPLSVSRWFRPLINTSEGRFHLCHWGVLVSDMSFIHTKQLINLALRKQTHDNAWSPDTLLGKMYQLERVEGSKNTVNITRSFRLRDLNGDWSSFACVWVGNTSMTDSEISHAGLRDFTI